MGARLCVRAGWGEALRWAPRTLLVRAFLLIVVLILLSLAAAAELFRHAVQGPRAQQVAQLVVSTVNLTRAAVLSSAPEWRGALLAELRDEEGVRVQPADPGDLIEPLPEHPPELREMVEKVRARLGAETRFAAARNGEEALWISFRIGADEFWLALPSERLEHPLPSILLAWGGVVLVLALLGAYWIARQVVQPLGRLALAAQQVGERKVPPLQVEQGAQEVVAVARAFNRMSADLAAHERERALVLAGISHDLRTPLARVRLAAEMCGDAVLRDGLIADVEQMDAVVGQFLDYARLDEGEQAVALNLSGLVCEVAQGFTAQARKLELDLPPLPPVSVRPLLLRRALSNLLDNAVKYGGGEISVTLRRLDGAVEIRVEDRGPGIPAADVEAAKRPFVRLPSARSDAGGSGLGLSIVERVARLHRGDFELRPRDGGGLVARLALPA